MRAQFARHLTSLGAVYCLAISCNVHADTIILIIVELVNILLHVCTESDHKGAVPAGLNDLNSVNLGKGK